MTTSLIVDLDAEVRKYSKPTGHKKTTVINQPASQLKSLADEINTEHAAVESAMNQSLDHAMRCGELLIEAKGKCAHGKWTGWLKDNFHGSDRSARVYMRLAKYRHVIEAKRQSSADLTIVNALDYIAPKPEKPRIVDPNEADFRRLRDETILVESVLKFDDIVSEANALRKPPEVVFAEYFPESQSPNDPISFDQYQTEVESWRAADWFPEALKRVRQQRDDPVPQQVACDNIEVSFNPAEIELQQESGLDAIARPYREAVRQLNAISKTFKELADSQETGGHLVSKIVRITHNLEEARIAISEAEPVEICGCDGKGCRRCQQTGFLTRSQIKSLKGGRR